MDKTTKKVAQRNVTRIQAYQNVFNSREGNQVLYDLMSTHGMLSPQFPKDCNVNELVYREGARSVVLRILTLLKADPNQLLERIKEYESEIS